MLALLMTNNYTMRILLIMAVLFFNLNIVTGQEMYFTRNGKVSFFSKTPMENIDAVNNEVFSVMNLSKGEIAFAILVKSFRFEKALMEEHFNENYMESTKFPKATFNGKIEQAEKLSLNKAGQYPVHVSGDLTIHGVTKKINTEGTITVSDSGLQATSTFNLKVKDFNIEIPSLVADKIAETIEVTINCSYAPK